MSGGFIYMMLQVYCAPIVAALLSIAFLNLGGTWSRNSTDTKLRNLLTVYCFAVAVNWALGTLSIFMPRVTADLSGLVYALILLVPVMLYHFLYVMTADHDDNPFSVWHYALPAGLFIVITVWSLLMPQEVRLISAAYRPDGIDPVTYDNMIAQGGVAVKCYYILVRSTYPMRLLYTVIYTILGTRRILRYKKRIADFSADIENSYLGWLLLSFPLLLAPVVIAFMNPYEMQESLMGVFSSLGMFIQLPILCYHTLAHRYVLISSDNNESANSTTVTQNLGNEKFEEFISASKPYLNAKLQITDLTGALSTNRSYLSSFINNTYGMNFSQFINEYRLKELDLLVADPENENKGTLELIQKAGFGSYHSYYRAKKEQDKRKMLSM